MEQSKKSMRKKPRMTLRLFDPRDDRIGGNEENDDDDFEQTSPLIVKHIPRSKAKEVK